MQLILIVAYEHGLLIQIDAKNGVFQVKIYICFKY